MVRRDLPALIATDLDGTLVRDDETVSAYTRAVLRRVHSAGIWLVGATGRGPRLIDLVCHDIPEADFLVLGGGSRVVDVRQARRPVVLKDARLPGEVLADLLAVLENEVGALSVLIEADDAPDASLWGDPDPAWRWPEAVEARVRAQCLDGPVIKGFARHPDHDADTLLAIARTLIPPRVATVTQAGVGYIEILPPGVSKATGLAAVTSLLDLSPSDVLVFGDMPNDLAMFAAAGFGRVAVANAHPVVRTAADEVTLSNNNDGVAVYLDRLLSSRRPAAA